MKHKVTLIPGDGIGPEVSEAAKRCIEASGVDIACEEVFAGCFDTPPCRLRYLWPNTIAGY